MGINNQHHLYLMIDDYSFKDKNPSPKMKKDILKLKL